jgi:hypothetical protein
MIRLLAGAAALVALAACAQGQDRAAGSAQAGSAQGQAPAAGSAQAAAGSAQAAGAARHPAAGAAQTAGQARGSAAASQEREFRIVGGFRAPRSILYDVEADVYLVSNVNGDPTAADDDDNGFISRVSPDGKVLELKWIDGTGDDALQLSAPKGMAIYDGQLWVADRYNVHAFDAQTGRHRATYKIAQATSLADVAILEGSIIITDNGSDLAGGLFRLGWSRTPRPFLAPDQPGIGNPQGIYAPGDGSLWVTSDKELYRVVKGARGPGVALPRGGLDGIIGAPDGELLVASHEGVIFRGTPRQTRDGAIDVAWTELFTGLEAPTDLGFDARRGRVLIPLVLANAIEVRELPPRR